jgi:hypothetical protein
MPTFAPVRPILLSAMVFGAALASALPASAQTQPMPPETMPEAGPPPDMECAGEPITGSGPGFSSSRDASEQAAREAWLEKAKAIYPEATWESAYQANLSCAVQGLYSKCFAQAIPCRPKSGDASADDADDANADADADAPDAAAETSE